MKPPERKEIADIIASPSLLQKDRAGRALFISDFLRRADKLNEVKAKLHSRGYICHEMEGQLVLIDWTQESYNTYLKTLPELSLPGFDSRHAMLYGTCRLLMQHPSPLQMQDISFLSYCLRLALLGEKNKLLRTLQSALADSLREKRPPPYHGAKICLEFFGY